MIRSFFKGPFDLARAETLAAIDSLVSGDNVRLRLLNFAEQLLSQNFLFSDGDDLGSFSSQNKHEGIKYLFDDFRPYVIW